jgi:Winged helix DNA-binding domain
MGAHGIDKATRSRKVGARDSIARMTATERILTPRALNRALLARQHLLARSTGSLTDVVEQIGGLQTQYAPSGYVGLWTRVDGFRRKALTTALEDRSLIQATLMRVTIHVVSKREFWRYAMGVREARRAWARRAWAGTVGDGDEPTMIANARRLSDVLAEGPRTVKELGDLGAGFVGNLGLWVDLVRVPPSGTWERRRADRLGLAEDWVGPPDATEAEGLMHLVRAYLRAFGPAAWRDIASWAGIPVTEARRGGQGLTLATYRDEDGRELVDLADGELPDPGTPAPVRFLPHWDATLLVHARRTGILPEPHRARIFTSRNPFSVGTYLVDGAVAGGWSVREGRIVLDPYDVLTTTDQRAVDDERDALDAFHAP